MIVDDGQWVQLANFITSCMICLLAFHIFKVLLQYFGLNGGEGWNSIDQFNAVTFLVFFHSRTQTISLSSFLFLFYSRTQTISFCHLFCFCSIQGPRLSASVIFFVPFKDLDYQLLLHFCFCSIQEPRLSACHLFCFQFTWTKGPCELLPSLGVRRL